MRSVFPDLTPKAERALNERFDAIERRLARFEGAPVAPAALTADFVAQEGQTLVVAAPAAGLRGLLPEPRSQNRSAAIHFAFTTDGPVTLSCPGGTVNGEATLTSRHVGAYTAFCDGATGWYVLPFAGDATFNGAVTLGTLQTQASASGALSVTLAANVTRLLITSTADVTLSTISGCADGRVLVLEHERASGTGNLIISHGTGANAIATPNARAHVITGRGSALLVGRGTNWKLHGPPRSRGVVQTDASGGGNNFALDEDTETLFVTANATYTGLVRPAGNSEGDMFFVQCDGGVAATIPFNSSSSTAGNRVAGPNGQTLVLPSRSLTKFVYRDQLWRALLVAADPFITGPEASNLATPFVIRVAFTALAAGTADDVTIYNATAPFAFRIVDCFALISTAILATTVTLRSASGGGGSALSSALSSAATGTARNNDTATRTVASGGSLFLRRSDRGVAGEIVIICVRT